MYPMAPILSKGGIAMSPVAITLALLLFVIVMFVWEKIPLAVTSIIALLVLVLTGVLSPKDAFGGFVDNNLILFVAMFVIGGCFFETGMANRVGGIVTKFAHTERELIVAVMLVTGIMSGFLSNTGTAAILIPIVIGTASKSGFSRSRLLLPLIFAAAMGGNLSIIGAPGNLLGKAALQNVGVEISFFEYGFVGLPILLISTAFFACVGYRFLPEKTKNMGDSMALAKALQKTGAGKMIADTVISALGPSASPFALLVVVFLLATLMKNFMSNFATTALLVPISLNISAGMGADPKAVVVATVIGASLAFATPIGMPANMMVFAPGGYTFNDYVKAGLPMIVVSAIISLILLPLIFPFYP